MPTYTEAQIYEQYQGLLDAMNYVILNGPDDARALLQPLSQKLTNLLDGDDMLHFEANEAKFKALTQPMKTVNDSLQAAEQSIKAVSARLADAGKVIATLTQVLETAAKFA